MWKWLEFRRFFHNFRKSGKLSKENPPIHEDFVHLNEEKAAFSPAKLTLMANFKQKYFIKTFYMREMSIPFLNYGQKVIFNNFWLISAV